MQTRAILLLFATLPLTAAAQQPHAAWLASWSPALQTPEPQNALPDAALTGATLRQTVHLSLGGQAVRVVVANTFGTAPLHLGSARLALAGAPGSARILPDTSRTLTFDGATEVTIPAGAEYLSDPVPLAVKAHAELSISLFFSVPPRGQTGHPGSRTTSYLVPGDHTAEPDLPEALRVDHWYQLAAVEVLAPPGAATVVALGDSITDGRGSTTNGNDRWTDLLARRLTQAALPVAVVNKGIGGNHLLVDGLGPSALARFDRDVLATPGLHWLVVFEGINDLGGLALEPAATPADHAALVARMEGAYRQLVQRAHAHGVTVLGATLTPWIGSAYYHPEAASEADRRAVNDWIRAPGHFDAVLDLDRALRDPAQPDRLLPANDSGDHLHPSPAGYRAIANAIPLGLFAQPGAGAGRKSKK